MNQTNRNAAFHVFLDGTRRQSMISGTQNGTQHPLTHFLQLRAPLFLFCMRENTKLTIITHHYNDDESEPSYGFFPKEDFALLHEALTILFVSFGLGFGCPDFMAVHMIVK